MSGYCPVCGVYCEEDDDRVCAACKAEKKNHYCPECAAKWADEAFAAVRMVKADEINRLTRENADLRARLAAVTKDRDNELADNTGLALKIAAVSEELDNFKAIASRETSRRLEAEKARDEQAEAVGVLAKELRWWADCADELHTCHVDNLPCEACENIRRLNAATRETQNNAVAAAAVKEASEIRDR